jgi:hypothetical protein
VYRRPPWGPHPGASETWASARAHLLLFSKFRLGPGRIAVALLWLSTLYGLVKTFERKLLQRLGWLLIPLG